MKVIKASNGDNLTFDDDVPDDEIRQAYYQYESEISGQSSFGKGVRSGFANLVSGPLVALGALTDSDMLKEAGREIQEGTQRWALTPEQQQSAMSQLANITGSVVPSVAQTFAIPMTSIPAIAANVGLLGSQSFGGNILRQEEENKKRLAEGETERPINYTQAGLAALGQTAVEYLLGAQPMIRSAQGIGLLGKPAAERLLTTGTKTALGRIARTATEEAGEEVIQQAMERLQAGVGITGPGALAEYAQSAIGGAMGGAMGGAGVEVANRAGLINNRYKALQEALNAEAEAKRNVAPVQQQEVSVPEAITPLSKRELAQQIVQREVENIRNPIQQVPVVEQEAQPVSPYTGTHEQRLAAIRANQEAAYREAQQYLNPSASKEAVAVGAPAVAYNDRGELIVGHAIRETKKNVQKQRRTILKNMSKMFPGVDVATYKNMKIGQLIAVAAKNAIPTNIDIDELRALQKSQEQARSASRNLPVAIQQGNTLPAVVEQPAGTPQPNITYVNAAEEAAKGRFPPPAVETPARAAQQPTVPAQVERKAIVAQPVAPKVNKSQIADYGKKKLIVDNYKTLYPAINEDELYALPYAKLKEEALLNNIPVQRRLPAGESKQRPAPVTVKTARQMKIDELVELTGVDPAKLKKTSYPKIADMLANAKKKETQGISKTKFQAVSPIEDTSLTSVNPAIISDTFEATPLNQQQQQRLAPVIAQVQDTVNRFLGAGADIVLADHIARLGNGEPVSVRGAQVGNAIYVALGMNDQNDWSSTETAAHEAWHFLRENGTFDDNETKLLDNAKESLARYVAKRYGVPVENLAAMDAREVEAQAFGLYAQHEMEGKPHGLKEKFASIFRKAMKALRNLAVNFQLANINSFEQLFDNVIAGGKAKIAQQAATNELAIARYQDSTAKYTSTQATVKDEEVTKYPYINKAVNFILSPVAMASKHPLFSSVYNAVTNMRQRVMQINSTFHEILRPLAESNISPEQLGEIGALALSMKVDGIKTEERNGKLVNAATGEVISEDAGMIKNYVAVQKAMESAVDMMESNIVKQAMGVMKLDEASMRAKLANTNQDELTIDSRAGLLPAEAIDTILKMSGIYNQLQGLRKADYMPESRFGNMGIKVILKDREAFLNRAEIAAQIEQFDIDRQNIIDKFKGRVDQSIDLKMLMENGKAAEVRAMATAGKIEGDPTDIIKAYQAYRAIPTRENIAVRYSDGRGFYIEKGEQDDLAFYMYEQNDDKARTDAEADIKERFDSPEFEVVWDFPINKNSILSSLPSPLQTFETIWAMIDHDDTDWQIHEKLRQDINNKGIYKHLLNAKHIHGSSTDYAKVLSRYITGMSNFIASQEMQPLVDESMVSARRGLPAGSQLLDYIEKYYQYNRSPQEEFRSLKMLNFMYVLGMRPSTGLLQLSTLFTTGLQSLMNVSPTPATHLGNIFKGIGIGLSEFHQGREFLSNPQEGSFFDFTNEKTWDKLVKSGVFTDREARLGMELAMNGYLAPLFTVQFMNMGKAEYGTGKAATAREKLHNTATWVMNKSGMFISSFEQLARFSFVYSMLKTTKHELNTVAPTIERLSKYDQRLPEQLRQREAINGSPLTEDQMRLEIIKFLMDESFSVFGKTGRSQYQRGIAGSLLFPFTQYSEQAVEGIARNLVGRDHQSRVAALTGLMGLMALGGVVALPGVEAMKKLVELLAEKLFGKTIDSQHEMQKIVSDVIGNVGADALIRGIPSAIGIELGTRVRTPLPMEDVLLSITGLGYDKQPLEYLGIPGNLSVKGLQQMAGDIAEGDILGAAIDVMPQAIKDVYNYGIRYPQDGYNTAAGNQIVAPEDITGFDQLVGAMGFTPKSIIRSRLAARAAQVEKQKWVPKLTGYRNALVKEFNSLYQAQKRGDMKAVIAHRQKLAEIRKDMYDFRRINKVKLNVDTMINNASKKARSLVDKGYVGNLISQLPKTTAENIENIY